MADDAYEFMIHLTDGQTVVADITAASLDGLTANNPRYILSDADRDDPTRAAATLLYSILTYRMDKGSGWAGVHDREGRNWMIAASSIVAFSYRAPGGGSARRDLGFVKPKEARGAYSTD
jgi:hypothetical protein